MSRVDDIAKLGREEHEDREARRKVKRDQRRGTQKPERVPRSLRSRRSSGKKDATEAPDSSRPQSLHASPAVVAPASSPTEPDEHTTNG